ncbi:MAG: hypothetical protein IKV54_02790, partial [Clostridia bacterium]|nr:hypothetical protein [Clostridia bacterium]
MRRNLYFVLCVVLLLALCSCSDNGDVTYPTDEKIDTTEPIVDENTEPIADDTTAADTGKQPNKPRFGKLSYKTDGFGIDYIITDADHVNVQAVDGDTVLLIMRYNGESSLDTYKIGIYDVNGREYEYLSEELASDVALYVISSYKT